MTGSEQVPATLRVCPFCGVTTIVPHETQQGCIDALQVEITRMRGILNHLRPLSALTPNPEDQQS